MERLNIKEFFSNDTWTCPAGVTALLVLGCGGGNGGWGGVKGVDIKGYTKGGSTSPILGIVSVIPNTSYSIIIGTGGTGGTGTTLNYVRDAQKGGNGSDSLFGSLFVFKGAICGGRMCAINDLYYNANQSCGGIYGTDGIDFAPVFAWGGRGGAPGAFNDPVTGLYSIGGEGGAVGGDTQAPPAGNAPANTGAGGGSGGNGSGLKALPGGNGGNGGSGRIAIMWVE